MATILIVDDSGFQRKFLSKALAEGGHRVLEATGGDQALEIAAGDRPDCILTDLIMPDMRGLAPSPTPRRPSRKGLPSRRPTDSSGTHRLR